MAAHGFHRTIEPSRFVVSVKSVAVGALGDAAAGELVPGLAVLVADDVGLLGGVTRGRVAEGVGLLGKAEADERGAVLTDDELSTAAEGVADADAGVDTCAALSWSACCSARALLHAARTAAVNAITAPKRARLDRREAKTSCHIRDLGG